MSGWAASRLGAALRQRCPVCRRGRIFSGSFAMNERCPVCGVKFEREPGYFLGAMYISYPMSAVLLGLGLLVGHVLLPTWSLEWLLLPATLAYLPFVPLVFRYSRVLWIHFERWSSPSWP